MKTFLSIAAFLLLGTAASAQSETVKKTGDEIEKGAKKVADKTAQVAAKGKAKITDQVYKDKEGPKGETVYIDNHSKYYWIDKKGKRHYATGAELKAKED